MAKKYLDRQDVDFLNESHDTIEKRPQPIIPRKKRRRKKGLILFLSLSVFLLSTFLYVQASASPLAQGLQTFPWIQSLKKLISNDNDLLVGEEADAINIVLIGMGGEGHDGGYLADTIMLARFKPSTKEIALVSFPRDLAVNIPDYGWMKINNANAYGGSELLMQMIGDVIGEEVAYYVAVDFDGFEDIVDDLGGIDIYVEREFTDHEYPTDGYQIQTIHFDQGMQHMDGATALMYSRSRHGDNGEAGDFARSARQQKVLFAIKDKATSANTLFNPTKLVALYNNFTKYVDTNITPTQIVRLAQLGQGMRFSNISNTVLIDGPQGLLESTIGESGAYLLIPKAGYGNFTEIRAMINSLFTSPEELAAQAALEAAREKAAVEETVVEEAEPEPELPRTIILNGTSISGYAGTVSELLEAEGFIIVSVANHEIQNIDETILYDLNRKKNPDSHDFLADLITYDRETKLSNDLEDYLNTLTSTSLDELDFVIILGADNAGLATAG